MHICFVPIVAYTKIELAPRTTSIFLNWAHDKNEKEQYLDIKTL